MSGKQDDVHDSGIKDPRIVIASKLKEKSQELSANIKSLEDPEKLLESYAIGRDIVTLTDTLFEIYGTSLENMKIETYGTSLGDMCLAVDFDGIRTYNDMANKMYRDKIVQMLLKAKHYIEIP